MKHSSVRTLILRNLWLEDWNILRMRATTIPKILGNLLGWLYMFVIIVQIFVYFDFVQHSFCAFGRRNLAVFFPIFLHPTKQTKKSVLEKVFSLLFFHRMVIA